MYPSLNPRHVGIQISSFDQGLLLAKRHGFVGYDFAISMAENWAKQHSPAALADLFASTRIRAGCWNLPFLPLGSEEDYQRGLAVLADQARLAQSVGALRAAIWIVPSSDTLTFRENFAFHVTRYRPIGKVLDDFG